MKRLEFGSTYDFTQRVSDVFEDDLSEQRVTVYGTYDFIKAVLENLISDGYPIGAEIELENFEIANYDKEFVLYLTEDGINVEKMWHEENEYHEAKYYDSESNVAFIHGECDAQLLKYIDSNIRFEVDIYDEDDEYDEDKDSNVVIHRDKYDEPDSFCKSWSGARDGVKCCSVFSYYSSDPDDLRDVAEQFGIEL